ncbi:hypothetical protein GIB67_012039 [Kingdonia uniflora]|uniref:Uncharacterized protein n=1 Tax=Kingdonia uniflora TaxID=39325 RepID=A0A7J7M0D3_9MAGN|nr:hypothetical protein GIB67_012039 [Kingdonia uniflora]
MGRPPCCNKDNMKKGPWTPEEDILLVTYIQEHGPGTWGNVPVQTGLMRCSKSCRLRWTNYLRPGIKRGKFSPHEETAIIHLQALLGNKWAAIASYLPERTDNDIKNFWNTHLEKKLKMFQTCSQQQQPIIPKGQWERRLQTDLHMAKKALSDALSLDTKPLPIPDLEPSNGYHSYAMPTQKSTTYAANADNISRLLAKWMTSSLKSGGSSASISSNIVSPFSLDSPDVSCSQVVSVKENNILFLEENTPNLETSQVPLSLIEKWLFDEGIGQESQDLIEMPHQHITADLNPCVLDPRSLSVGPGIIADCVSLVLRLDLAFIALEITDVFGFCPSDGGYGGSDGGGGGGGFRFEVCFYPSNLKYASIYYNHLHFLEEVFHAGEASSFGVEFDGLTLKEKENEVGHHFWCEAFRELIIEPKALKTMVKEITLEKISEEDERIAWNVLIKCGAPGHLGCFMCDYV